jgi:hypothetical protein
MIDSFFRFIFEKELKKQSLDSAKHNILTNNTEKLTFKF